MILPFLDRTAETNRLKISFTAKESVFVVLYGRRRCGKSSLLQKTMAGHPHVYYVGDERETALQRRALAQEIGSLISGFDRVEYRSWDDLFERWYADAPAGSILALDEFPYLVSAAPELPGILQKHLDRKPKGPVHLALCGSSQRMMHGLVLDASAPLYGRAREILKIEPLKVFYLQQAMGDADADRVSETYAAWGGIPRYWELALDYGTTFEAIRQLVLDPMGVLHREPERLLSDQMRDTRQAASLLSLISQGCHRLSEIAARLGKPATSLTRPLAILVELGLVRREIPFGASPRDSKRSLYKIADPFLLLWLKLVEPNRSMLEAGLVGSVADGVLKSWPQYLGNAWEELSRQSVPWLTTYGRTWKPAARWWGQGLDGNNLELDIVAASLENESEILVGEAKNQCTPDEVPRLLEGLKLKASRCPILKGKNISCALWIRKGTPSAPNVITAEDVIGSLK